MILMICQYQQIEGQYHLELYTYVIPCFKKKKKTETSLIT
jgi:hypothetical protein